ncbi:MAG: ABC transporter substrate binding protein [Betaproteobacteria bacterium]
MRASSEYVHRALERVAGSALSRRLPSAYPGPEFVDAGGLLSGGAPRDDLRSLFFRSAEYVDRILRGAKPGELPVEQPKRYEMTINLKTADALPLSVPQSVLLRADRVIHQMIEKSAALSQPSHPRP